MDLLEDEFDEILKIFQVESEEIISRLNNNLLSLEKKPSNKDSILVLFRDAHSLKGASRMIGFNNVQTIAHKVEDILGLAKDNKLQMNAKIVDILYKTVDFLSELIQKSIAKKQEVYSEKINEQISILENIRDYTEDYKKSVEKIDVDIEILSQNQNRVNNLISESLFSLMKLESEKDESFIEKLLAETKELHEIFQQTGPFEIKKRLEDVNLKLDFVNKATHSLTNDESEELQENLNEVIVNLNSIYELHGLNVVDHYALAFEKLAGKSSSNVQDSIKQPLEFGQKTDQVSEPAKKTEPLEEIEIEEEINFEQEAPPVEDSSTAFQEWISEGDDLFLIKDKIASLAQSFNSLAEIKEFLINSKNTCIDENVKHIVETIIKILVFAEKNEMLLNEETISVLEQSLEYCDNKLKNKSETADNELTLQRLEIVQQLLEFNAGENEDYLSTPQKKYSIKSKKIADFSTFFDSGEIKTLRVDSLKLDTLINQVGELITTKVKTKKHLHELNKINKGFEEWQRASGKTLTYLKYYDKKYFSNLEDTDSQTSLFIKQLLGLYSEHNKKFADALSSISALQRTIQEDDAKTGLIIDDLESMVKSIRVLPLATIFHLFGRMIRDIAQEKNKKIDLEIIGSETSTDKKIIEEIKTPLIHIIRNAIDHGIETPEERIALGKNPEGKIILSARQVENKILIEIQDDGKGINIEKIKEKAVHNGYLSREEVNSMTDEQLTNIIFTPGFSTGEEITNISGRGIGLDVVHTKISQLNGKVKVFSEMNKGCCVQIELPTTMSTLKSFLVKSSGQTFAIPMTAINMVMLKKTDEIFCKKGNKTIIFNEKTIPLYVLSDVLNLPKRAADSTKLRETVLIIESDSKTIGLSVDKLIGDQEILQKKLSAPFYKLKNISGLTTLASGEICLILNISELLKNINLPNAQLLGARGSGVFADKTKKCKILLVDDSITTRTLEKNILTQAGYVIEIATNPVEALEKMKTERFDLLISDIEMPEMDGFAFLTMLKTDEMYYDIPVIMVSSLPSDENNRRARELGAEGYIVKGEFNQDEFLDAVTSALNTRD